MNLDFRYIGVNLAFLYKKTAPIQSVNKLNEQIGIINYLHKIGLPYSKSFKNTVYFGNL
jgi:hypothetical protein